MFRRKFN